MTSPAPPAEPPPGRAACRFCGAPLDPHQAARGEVCAAPLCERQRVQEASRSVFRRGWNEFVGHQRRAAAQAAPLIARALRKLGSPGKAAIGVVPRLARPLAALPADRRADFEARLDEIIGDAFAEPTPEPGPEDERRAREEAPEHALAAATCATCQGLCCTLGGARRAFLEVSDIQRYRQRHPQADALAIRAHYLARLPELSVENSCVYQSATGCTLDRADRADICNRYHCNPQTHLLARMREMKAREAVIIAKEDDTEAAVATFDTRTGCAPLPGDAGADGGIGPEEIAAARDAALAQVPAPLPALPEYAAQAPSRCAHCGAELDRHRAAASLSCGAPACEAARTRELARAAAESRPHVEIALAANDPGAGA